MNNHQFSEEDVTSQLLAAADPVKKLLDDELEITRMVMRSPRFFDNIYVPSQKLIATITEYEKWVVELESEEGKNKQDNKKLKLLRAKAGEMMEKIAYLTFKCLEGHDGNIAAGQTEEGPQLDLIITGSSSAWPEIMKKLHLPDTCYKIIVEAKNTDDKVQDKHFARLGFILETKYPDKGYLGIFFSRKGATGFPKPNKPQKTLFAARASQVIFRARSNRYLIVLDHSHIIRLKERGALPRLILALVNDVADTLGHIVSFDGKWIENRPLPPHLKELDE